MSARFGACRSSAVGGRVSSIQRNTDIDTAHPKSKLVHVFPGAFCGVPTIVGHNLIQSDRATKGLIVLDISNPSQPIEVSRLRIEYEFMPHWTGWGARIQHHVVTGYGDDHRLFLVKLDPANGTLSMDTAFHDAGGKPGFGFDERLPSGWQQNRADGQSTIIRFARASPRLPMRYRSVRE